MKFTLPLPPCINQTYGVSRNGYQAMFKKRPVKNWEFVAGWEVKRQWKGKPLDGPVSLEIHWFYKNDRDIDAGLKVLLDLFQKQSVYLNDGQVRRITNMTIDEDKKNPRVEVEINEIK